MDRTTNFYFRALAFFIALLGFISCGGNEDTGNEDADGPGKIDPVPDPDPEYPMAEYGVPHACYRVSGRVVDSATGEAVPGIKATFTNQDNSYMDPSESLLTGADGYFEVGVIEFPMDELYFNLLLEDVDGPVNGLYEDVLLPVTFLLEELDGGEGGWYRGTALRELDEVEMKEISGDNKEDDENNQS